MSPFDRFRYEVEHDGPNATVHLGGDLDMAATLRLEPAIERLVNDGVEHLVVDLSGVKFIDSTGWSLLLALNDQATRAGTRLEFLRPGQEVARALAVAGLDGVLPFAGA